MTTRTRTRRRLAAAAGAGALVLTALVAAGPAQASHPEVSLPGSNFEIDTDANLKVDDPAPSIDWANVDQVRKGELFQGAQDDSFGQGSKEDTAVPTVVDGSIPPNKSDLLNFGLYLEEAAAGDFLHLFWHSVQEPTAWTKRERGCCRKRWRPCLSNGTGCARTTATTVIPGATRPRSGPVP